MYNHIINKPEPVSLQKVFEALEFAAYKHRRQKRKGAIGIPYINHPIEVAGMLVRSMNEPSKELIIAALLHDTMEDTDVSNEEIEEKFGKQISDIVSEVTDNMSLPSEKRRKIQIEKAHSLSYEARCIKITDKTCNIHDMLYTKVMWSRKRKINYIIWAKNIVEQIQGTHNDLESAFNNMLKESETLLKTRL
jgi:guanosine-3',5'-bis(diphosphate) 3'-pyrophosphohydrolase